MARYPESFITDWGVADYELWLKVEFMTMPLSILAFAYYFRSFSGHFLSPQWMWNIILWMGLGTRWDDCHCPHHDVDEASLGFQVHMLLGVVWLISRLLSAWADHVRIYPYGYDWRSWSWD